MTNLTEDSTFSLATACKRLGILMLILLPGCTAQRTRYDLTGVIPTNRTYIEKCAPKKERSENTDELPSSVSSGSLADRSDWCIENYFSDDNLDKLFEQERWRMSGRPSIGLALSGGGTKSADFAIGVIAGAYKNLLKPGYIQLISSASGGGYAALWYLSRLLDAYANVPTAAGAREISSGAMKMAAISFDSIFSDCLPRHYESLAEPASSIKDYLVPPLCPDNPAHFPFPSDGQESQINSDPYRYQTQLRGFQDILSNNYNIEQYSESKKRYLESNKGITHDTGKSVLLTTVGFLPYHFANTLFDWRMQSFTRVQYSRGIERTFDLMPPLCISDDTSEKSTERRCIDFRSRPNRLAGRGHTFAAMRLVREMQWESSYLEQKNSANGLKSRTNSEKDLPPLPFWIANTTAATRTQLSELFSRRPYDLRDHVFEFTPTGFGSRRFGYWEGSHPDIDTIEATVASGGFFDAQERDVGQPARSIVNPALKLATLQWGRDIENPNQLDNVRGWHKGLPVPFYFFDPQSLDLTPPGLIHLSDGGQSENSGIYSLVRRGVKQIVFEDGASDARGQFRDLCNLHNNLMHNWNIYLLMDDLEDFEAFCEHKLRIDYPERKGYDLWKAPLSRVLVGCVTTVSKTKDCAEARKDSKKNSDKKTSNDYYFADLFVLKPMLPWRSVHSEGESNLVELASQCISVDGRNGTEAEKKKCKDAFHVAQRVLPGLTAELFGYLVDRHCTDTVFPQHQTWKMTFNSSSSRFGAYRDLGRAMASALTIKDGEIHLSDEVDRAELGNRDRFLFKLTDVDAHPQLDKIADGECSSVVMRKKRRDANS